MNAIELISQDVFDKVRSRYSNLEMGDEDGNITSDPRTARFFDFDFISEGKNLGRVSISINERGALKIFYSQGILEGLDPVAQKSWFNFLREMRSFAKRRLLRFDTRDITKSNLDKNDFQYLAQTGSKEDTMAESRMYGSSLTSYRPLSKAKIIIKHSNPIDVESRGARSRDIKSIFIQNEEGERWKMPVVSVRAAEAMARHIANGGYPHDECGKKIVEMATEIAKLHAFKRQVGKHDSMNSDANKILERACMKLESLKAQMSSLGKQHHYEAWKESFVPGGNEELTIDETTMEDYKSKFTISTFKEDLAQYFPLIHKIMQETSEVDLEEYVGENKEEHCDTCDKPVDDCECDHDHEKTVKEFAEFENWADAIVEGRIEPDTLASLKELLGNESFKTVGPDATNAVSALQNIGIQDEQLEKDLEQLARDTNGEGDPSHIIMAWIQKEDPGAALQFNTQDQPAEPEEPEASAEVPQNQVPAAEEAESYKEPKRPTIASVAEMVSSFYNRHHMEEGLGPFPMGKQGVVTKVTKEMGEWAGELAGRLVDHYSQLGPKRHGEQPVDEVSSELLGRYKKGAAKQAGHHDLEAEKAVKAGDVEGGKKHIAAADKRFSGIVKATKKQFANDLKSHNEESNEGYDQVGFLKQIVSNIHPYGGSREDFQKLVAKEVPGSYSQSAEFVRDFNKAYDEFYGLNTDDDEEDDFDYTDYTMRQGEMGNPDRMKEGQEFNSKQEVIDYFVKQGKTAEAGAAAWDRGWRGSKSAPKSKSMKDFEFKKPPTKHWQDTDESVSEDMNIIIKLAGLAK